LALDMEGMGKGQIWINGQSIGRYWTAFLMDRVFKTFVVDIYKDSCHECYLLIEFLFEFSAIIRLNV